MVDPTEMGALHGVTPVRLVRGLGVIEEEQRRVERLAGAVVPGPDHRVIVFELLDEAGRFPVQRPSSHLRTMVAQQATSPPRAFPGHGPVPPALPASCCLAPEGHTIRMADLQHAYLLGPRTGPPPSSANIPTERWSSGQSRTSSYSFTLLFPADANTLSPPFHKMDL